MDDFKIVIYILAAVAYFVLTQWRKAFKGGPEAEEEEPEPRRNRPHHPLKPATSFEDILRELQPKLEQARQQGQEVVQQAKERTRELAQPAMVPAAEAVPKYRNYDEMAPKVLSWEKKAEAIEAAKQSSLRRKASFTAYEQPRKPTANLFAEMLRNPATARDAVILSEIFNRRYT
ncbi:hypothetical protein [Pontibacter flavimaris]|uniref:Uncharacterized protein n=1 Tax=Pontibacter flavimaris TaxID=1797110 RepID=A0A1Q5PGT8_9BACT|nr:hypothetical protein [Pontibacter flavimaris]OKL41440.1 hypothetical protein A3841_10325 [Pontibacter flavimaris]